MIEGWKGEGADNGRSTRLCVGNDISIKRERERERERKWERQGKIEIGREIDRERERDGYAFKPHR